LRPPSRKPPVPVDRKQALGQKSGQPLGRPLGLFLQRPPQRLICIKAASIWSVVRIVFEFAS